MTPPGSEHITSGSGEKQTHTAALRTSLQQEDRLLRAEEQGIIDLAPELLSISGNRRYNETSWNCTNNPGSQGILSGMWEGPSHQFLMVANRDQSDRAPRRLWRF